MKRRWILSLAVLSTIGVAVGQTHPVAVENPPATLPTTAPAASSGALGIDQLIKQMGSDDATDRDSAQKQLVSRGGEAVDALKDAAAHSDDSEIKSRAIAALAQIGEHSSFDASLITVHLKDTAVLAALSAIGEQAHAQITGLAPGIMLGVPNQKTLNLDADQKPFWNVMTDLCQQTNLCPLLDAPTKNTLRLYSVPRNWFVNAPHQIVGPYWLGVSTIYRNRTIDLAGPPITDDQFTMRFIVFPEPKLAVTQISEFTLKEASDDAGNSLVPTAAAAAAAPQAGLVAAMAMARSSNRLGRPTLRTVDARLAYPAHPGTRITKLRGEVVVTVSEGVQQFVVDDLLGTPKQTNPIAHCEIKITVNHSAADLYQIAIDCSRDGMVDDQWLAMANRVNDITLEDADGHPLMPYYVTTTQYTDTSFKCSAMFNKNVVNAAQMVGRPAAVRTGDPKRLTWNIATRLKPVTIPVTFSDLPMP